MDEKLNIINPEDKDYYDGKFYMVGLYPGAGVELATFYVYAGCEEEALELVVAYLDMQPTESNLLYTTDEIENYISESFADEFQAYMEENPDADTFQFATDYLGYFYIDATMQGASQPYFVEGSNLRVEETNDEPITFESKEVKTESMFPTDEDYELARKVVDAYGVDEVCKKINMNYETEFGEKDRLVKWLATMDKNEFETYFPEYVDEKKEEDCTQCSSVDAGKVDLVGQKDKKEEKKLQEHTESWLTLTPADNHRVKPFVDLFKKEYPNKNIDKLYLETIEGGWEPCVAFIESDGTTYRVFVGALNDGTYMSDQDSVKIANGNFKAEYDYINESKEVKEESIQGVANIADKIRKAKADISNGADFDYDSFVSEIKQDTMRLPEKSEQETAATLVQDFCKEFGSRDTDQQKCDDEICRENKEVKTEYYKMPEDEHIIWDSEVDYYDEEYMNDIKENQYQDYLDNFEPSVPTFDEWVEEQLIGLVNSGAYETEEEALEDMKADLEDEYQDYVENYTDEPLEFDTWYSNYISDSSYEDWELLEEDLLDNVFPNIDNQVNDNVLVLSGYYGSNYPDFRSSGAGGKLFTDGTKGFRDYMGGFDRVCITTQNGILGAICNDHDGTVSGQFYTLPDDKTELIKALGYEEIIKERYDEEDLDKYNEMDLMETEFNNDLMYEGIDARDLTEHLDLLKPIKDTISGYTPDPDKTKTESKEVKIENNRIPRNWKKITYKSKIDTNVDSVGDTIEIERDEWNRPIATNLRTGKTALTFLDMVRNEDLAEVINIETADKETESKRVECKELKTESVSYQDLVIAGESLWRDDARIYETRVEGIYDCQTAGHGGYLVDTDVFPELAKYGDKTPIDNIVGFEEDYEALKVIWAVPEVLEQIQLDKDWYKNLTLDDVLRYEDKLNDEFRKEFPNKKEIAEVPEMKTEAEDMTQVKDDIETAVEKSDSTDLEKDQVKGSLDVLKTDEESAIDGYEEFNKETEKVVDGELADAVKDQMEEIIDDEKEHIEKIDTIKKSLGEFRQVKTESRTLEQEVDKYKDYIDDNTKQHLEKLEKDLLSIDNVTGVEYDLSNYADDQLPNSPIIIVNYDQINTSFALLKSVVNVIESNGLVVEMEELEDNDTYFYIVTYKNNWNNQEVITEAEEVNTYKQRFIDYCKGKVEDLGTIVAKDKDDEDFNEELPVAMIDNHYEQAKPAYILIPDPDYDDRLVISDKDGNVFIDSPMSNVVGEAQEMTFDKIDTEFYNNVLEYWDELYMDDALELDDVDKASREKIQNEFKCPEHFDYNVISRAGGADVEVYCKDISDLNATTTTMNENGEYVQDYFDIDGLWQVNEVDDSGKFIKNLYINGWQEAMNTLVQQYSKVKEKTESKEVKTESADTTRIEQIAQEISSFPYIRDRMKKDNWLSGSSTTVHPVEAYLDNNGTGNITIQLDVDKNTFDHIIELFVNHYPEITDGWFSKSDGSCPNSLYFKYKEVEPIEEENILGQETPDEKIAKADSIEKGLYTEEMTLVESYDNEKDADVISKALARRGCKTEVRLNENKYEVWSNN